jgi:uncharacterized DUF497 family protein
MSNVTPLPERIRQSELPIENRRRRFWIVVDTYTGIVYGIRMNDMVSAPDFEGFDWTGGNAEKNWKRHGVAPAEAEQVFFNTPLLWGDDPTHSGAETRYYALGQTDEGRALFVAFTMPGHRLRVVSARDMSRKERRVYRS